MNINKKYFGIIKWYDKVKNYGLIQCQEIGDAGFKPYNFDSEVENINPNSLVLFSITQNGRGRNIAKEITYDYLKYVKTNYRKFSKGLIDVILSYGNEETKKWLRSKLNGDNQQSSVGNVDLFNAVLKNNDSTYADKLLKNLADGVKNIDSNDTYSAAIQILNYNKINLESEYIPDLPYSLYLKANDDYKFELWLNGHISFCNLELIKQKFESATSELKQKILTRCQGNKKGFLINEISDSIESSISTSTGDVYFDGIRDKIINEIKKAKESIYIAVAWFTNHYFLEALYTKVEEGVHVELMILNDYINNWVEGLDFQKFIDLGKNKGNSNFYFCGVDNIMHHKFCIIDEQILFNGSYNWTYYAEHRNHENCMIFRNNLNLVEKFKLEFEAIKSSLSPVNEILPFERDLDSNLDIFSCREYRSKDLEYKAKDAIKQNNFGNAYRIAEISLQINPENAEAIRFLEEVKMQNEDEETIRKATIEKEIIEKQKRQQNIEEEIAKQKLETELRQKKEREERDKEIKAKLEEEKLLKERQLKEEEEKMKLKAQEEELKAKKQLEEQERLRLAELEKKRELLLKNQEEEKLRKEKQDKENELKRAEELKKKQAEEKRQEELLAQKEDERKRLEEERLLLESTKSTSLQGKRGKLRINLQWKTFDDLDLHVYDPANNHIYYQAKEATCQNSIGKLDVDANAGSGQTKTPQENIFWDNEAPEGNYKVEVNFFTKRELNECPFVATIIPELGEPKIYTSKVIGEKNTVKVVEFSYHKNEGMIIKNSI